MEATPASSAEVEPFDFARHEQRAITEYLRVFDFYKDLASAARRIVDEALARSGVQVHSVQARAKDPNSLGRKASKPSKGDPTSPMYPSPLTQITDLAAIRIITFFPRTIEQIDQLLKSEFVVIEQTDKGETLLEEDKFGYKSVHYLVKFTPARTSLPEYARFKEAIVEVQARTILQHAWAEIEHDIQYKSSASIPRDIRRRFMSLAGLLEIADREFQAIQDADRALTARAEGLVSSGQLEKVEVAPAALKTYLDKRLGPDGRVSDFSYDWTVRLLRKLGYQTLAQVDESIRPYDDDRLSRLAFGNRQGQLTRFEAMLLAALGEKFIERHMFANEEWFNVAGRKKTLEAVAKAGYPVGFYDPIPSPKAGAGAA